MRQCGIFLAFLVGSTLLCAQVEAAVTVFTDSTAWNAAAGATVLEDFNDETAGPFNTDLSGTDSVTGFTGFDLSIVYNGDYVGIATGSSNLGVIDGTQSLAWTEFPSNAGWSSDLDWGSGYQGPTITLWLEAGTTAVAFDWLDIDDGSGIWDRYQMIVTVESEGGSEELTYSNPPFSSSTGSGFFGITSTTVITSIEFVVPSPWGGSITGFAIDNVRTNAPTADVPEPVSLAVWSVLGGLGMVVARRRKKLAA